MQELAGTFGFAIDPDALVQDITVGQQQRVEILKALYRKADILILDEPTAVLTPQEATSCSQILRSLTDEGLLDHLHHATSSTRCSRSPTASRCCGAASWSRPSDREGATEASLAKLMVGREVLLDVEKAREHTGRDGAPASTGCASTTTAGSRRYEASRSRCVPARSSASPGSTATARRS